MTKANQTLSVFILTALLVVSGFAQANRLQDLVGARAGQAEGDLESRGYVLTHSDKSDDSGYGYWWSGRERKCVVVRTEDGRYRSIVDTYAPDCNQREKSDNNNTVKAAVGIGAAAAIIGAIVLAHKAHHHDDDQHKDDAKLEAEYDRGYRDGLYNNSYHNYSDTTDYRKGYEAGVNQRRQETSYSSGYGGYKPFSNVLSLMGERASSGESELQSRGFRNVRSFKAGNASYTYWFNSNTSQCIQVSTVDGRFSTVLDLPRQSDCR